MPYSRNRGSSLEVRNLLHLETLEERCVPTLSGVLDSVEPASLLAPSQPALLQSLPAIISPIQGSTTEAVPSANTSSSTTVGLNGQSPVITGQQSLPTGSGSVVNLGSLLSPLTDLVKGVSADLSVGINGLSAVVTGIDSSVGSAVLAGLDPEVSSGSGLPPLVSLGVDPHSVVSVGGNLSSGTAGTQTLVLLPADLDVQGDGVILEVQVHAEVGNPGQTTGSIQGINSALAGTTALLAALDGSAAQGDSVSDDEVGNSAFAGYGQPAGQFAVNSLAFFLENVQAARVGSFLSSLPGSSLGFGLGQERTFATGSSSWAPLQAGQRLSAELLGSEPADLVLQQSADLLQSEEGSAVLGEQQVDLASLTPVSSGLLPATDDLGALDRALQDFLSGLTDLRQSLTSWLTQLGPTPWILMGLALVATVSQEVARRRRSSREDREVEEPMEGDPFSALADA